MRVGGLEVGSGIEVILIAKYIQTHWRIHLLFRRRAAQTRTPVATLQRFTSFVTSFSGSDRRSSTRTFPAIVLECPQPTIKGDKSSLPSTLERARIGYGCEEQQ